MLAGDPKLLHSSDASDALPHTLMPNDCHVPLWPAFGAFDAIGECRHSVGSRKPGNVGPEPGGLALMGQ